MNKIILIFKTILNFLTKLRNINVIDVKVKKLDDNAVVMTYAHDGDVCMDMTATSVEYDEETDTYIYHTGIAVETNKNVGMFLFPRSSNCKKECYLTNSVGVADTALYRGELQFRYKNRTSLKVLQELEAMKVSNATFLNEIYKWDGSKKTWNDSFIRAKEITAEANQGLRSVMLERAKNLEFAPYKVGDRIGQALFLNHKNVIIKVVNELSETVRGNGGFGSTGK